MTTEEIVKKIKVDFRLYMNGIVSTSMREKGYEYRINFGLTYPLIKRIAEKHQPNVELAERLWSEGVRESKLLAPLLYPIDAMDMNTALRWIDETPYNEVADICCMALFSKANYAKELGVECCGSDNDIKVYTGIKIISRVVREFSSDEIAEVLKIAKDKQSSDNRVIALAATDLIYRIEDLNLQ